MREASSKRGLDMHEGEGCAQGAEEISVMWLWAGEGASTM